MNELSWITRFFIFCGGFDAKTASDCDAASIQKLKILGSMVLIPVIIGFFSFSYATYKISGGNQTMAFIGGAVWAFVIFLIDRAIIGYAKPGFSLGMIGRFLLAIVIALTVSLPLELLVFQDAIIEQHNSELVTLQDATKAKYNDKITDVKQPLIEKEKAVNELYEDYRDESDGSGGTLNRGIGPVALAKYKVWQEAKTAFENEKEEVLREVRILKSEQRAEEIQNKKSNARGLLGDIRALNAIEDPIVPIATNLLRAFFLFIELIPILLKVTKTSNIYHDIEELTQANTKETMQMTNDYRLELNRKQSNYQLQLQEVKIYRNHIRNLITSEKEDTLSLMNEMQIVTDKRLNIKKKIFKIDDEVVRDKLLKELDLSFDRFLVLISSLAEQSTNFHSQKSKAL